jgi:hypothetical protein
MSAHIPAKLVAKVRRRAGQTCEYCLLPQAAQEATFHVDHIKPQAKDGKTTAQNLALACVTCSLRKAARTHGSDPRTNVRVALFHPRRDRWSDHFRFTRTWRIVGRTPKGRATVAALGMNRPAIVVIRQGLVVLGVFPRELPELPDK